MLDLLDILGFLLLLAGGWLWHDSLKAREAACSAAKAACVSEALLLLDDTVAIRRVSFGRNDEGELRLCRVYVFEYSDTGNDRRIGTMVLLGNRVLVINLNLPDAPAVSAFNP